MASTGAGVALRSGLHPSNAPDLCDSPIFELVRDCVREVLRKKKNRSKAPQRQCDWVPSKLRRQCGSLPKSKHRKTQTAVVKKWRYPKQPDLIRVQPWSARLFILSKKQNGSAENMKQTRCPIHHARTDQGHKPTDAILSWLLQWGKSLDSGKSDPVTDARHEKVSKETSSQRTSHKQHIRHRNVKSDTAESHVSQTAACGVRSSMPPASLIKWFRHQYERRDQTSTSIVFLMTAD